MARVIYTPDVKAKIVDAARTARANGRGWDEALMLAKSAGYGGSLGGLQQFVKKATVSATEPKARKKPGRKPKASAPVTDVDSIQHMIEQIVQKRLKNTFAKLRAVIDESERGK